MDLSSPALFGTALRRLIDQMDGALERAYAADGLDFRPRFTPVTRLLTEDGPQPIRALADRLGVSHSAVSQTVAQMRARDLVTVAAGRDARQRIVSASAALRAMLPRLRHHWDAAKAATAALDAEVAGLVATVARANVALEARTYDERLSAARHGAAGPKTISSADPGRGNAP